MTNPQHLVFQISLVVPGLQSPVQGILKVTELCGYSWCFSMRITSTYRVMLCAEGTIFIENTDLLDILGSIRGMVHGQASKYWSPPATVNT